jgi:hypothetical protein
MMTIIVAFAARLSRAVYDVEDGICLILDFPPGILASDTTTTMVY